MTPVDMAKLHAKVFSAARAWSATEFASLLDTKGTNICGDNRCFVLIRVALDEAEVLTIATDPSYRRQGLARETMTAAETLALEAGAAIMFLEVAEDNIAARALYDSCGYQQVGWRPGYYVPKDGPPVDALILRKELAAA